jgi:hypothetical protein
MCNPFRLSWKWLTGTNTLAYIISIFISTDKVLPIKSPCYKLLITVKNPYCKKLECLPLSVTTIPDQYSHTRSEPTLSVGSEPYTQILG